MREFRPWPPTRVNFCYSHALPKVSRHARGRVHFSFGLTRRQPQRTLCRRCLATLPFLRRFDPAWSRHLKYVCLAAARVS